MKIQLFPTYFQGNNRETGCGWKSSGQHWHSNDQRNHWQFGGQIQQDPGKYTLGAVYKLKTGWAKRSQFYNQSF